jgi:aryl-alcohol dehydrogenase-like predicted oxidoreductase
MDGYRMNHCTFDRSGLRVSRLTLGVVTFGAGNDIGRSIACLEVISLLVQLALGYCFNLTDISAAYSQGRSEEVVGQVLDDVAIDGSQTLAATRLRLPTSLGKGDVGLRRSSLTRTVKTGLKRLGRGHVCDTKAWSRYPDAA